MQAAVLQSNRQVVVSEIDSPTLPEGGALVKVTGCGVCGSDLDKIYYRDVVPGVVLGHEVVGNIETLHSSAKTRFRVGQRVVMAHHVPCGRCHYCQYGSPSMCAAFKQSNIVPGGFAQTIALSAAHLAHTVFAIPDEITDAQASCVEPVACCIRAVDRLNLNPGQSFLTVGLGFIGLVTSQYARIKGLNTLAIDLKPDRVALATSCLMASQVADNDEALSDMIETTTQHRGVDAVFLSLVTEQTLALALASVRNGGVIMLFSADGAGQAQIDPNILYFREITVMSSYSPSLEALQESYDLICRGDIRVDMMLETGYQLADTMQAVLDYKQGKVLKAFVTI